MKICPNCGKVLSYNSYFGAYICDNCNWENRVRTTQRHVFNVVSTGIVGNSISKKTIREKISVMK